MQTASNDISIQCRVYKKEWGYTPPPPLEDLESRKALTLIFVTSRLFAAYLATPSSNEVTIESKVRNAYCIEMDMQEMIGA